MDSEVTKSIDELYGRLKEYIDKSVQSLKDHIDETLVNITSKQQQTEKKILELKNSNEELKESLLQSQRELKKNNLVIFGLEQDGTEEEEDLYSKTLKLVNEKLNTNIDKNDINHLYRFGKAQNTRPIVVKLVHFRKKLEILKQGKLLKDSKLSIANDLTWQDRQDQMTLRKHLNEAKDQNLEAYIKRNVLMIGDTSYSVKDLKKLEEEQDGEEQLKNPQESSQKPKKETIVQKPNNPRQVQTQNPKKEKPRTEKETNLRPTTSRNYKYK